MGCSAGSVAWRFHSIHAFAVEKGAHLPVRTHDELQTAEETVDLSLSYDRS
jgi:hypothetical protein